WSLNAAARFFGNAYDQPTKSFYHSVLLRAEAGPRYEPATGWDGYALVEGEWLRIPEHGGLGDPSASPDAASAEREEYDQARLRLGVDRIGAVGFTLWPSVGRRAYRIQTRQEGDLLSRSSYWFIDATSFVDARVRDRVRLHGWADFQYEFHDIPS